MKSIVSKSAPEAVGPYAHGKWIGDLLFISGQVGMAKGAKGLISDQVEEQAAQALFNLRSILEESAMTWENAVKVNIYLADMSDYATVNSIYAQALKDVREMPARVCYEVARLPLDAKVEIEVIAGR